MVVENPRTNETPELPRMIGKLAKSEGALPVKHPQL